MTDREELAGPVDAPPLTASPVDDRIAPSAVAIPPDPRLAEWGYSTLDEALTHLGTLLEDQAAFDGLAAADLQKMQIGEEPVAWRFRYLGAQSSAWTVQKNRPHWYRDSDRDVELQPLYARPLNEQQGNGEKEG